MTPKLIGTLLTLVSLLSCTNRTNNNQADNRTTDSIQESSKTTQVEKLDTVTDKTNKVKCCLRGQAKPVIKKSVYPNTTFKLNEDNRTATETVELKTGDKLIIKHFGCEHFQLTFRFETERFQADTMNIKYWDEKVILLISEIKEGLDSTLDISGAEVAMKEYLIRIKDPEIGEFIGYGDFPYKKMVWLDRIQRLADKKFAIELTYTKRLD